MDHCIDGSILVPRRRAKREFRQSILEAWNHHCAYCNKPATTLDHVRPRSKGG
ncbi:MAG: HNH endonuclease, partial [Marivivens sp.]|nr:HNH endonuclease [Marivivens sp.]